MARARSRTRRRGPHSRGQGSLDGARRGEEQVVQQQEVDELGARRRRVQRLEESAGRREREEERERYIEPENEPRSNSAGRNISHATLKSSSSSRRRKMRDQGEEVKHRRHRRDGEGNGERYVYRSPISRGREKEKVEKRELETRTLRRDGESFEEEVPRAAKKRQREKKIKVVYVTSEALKADKHAEPRVRERHREGEGLVHKSRAHTSRRKSIAEALPPSPPRRSATTRVLHSDTRLPLRRSNTTGSHAPSTRSHIPSTAVISPTAKRSTFMGSFFGPAIQQHHNHPEPERLIECLTCLSDDIPRSKSAKLKCGHRMCHSCLKRIFRLSLTDPQHMPPKCCTADHIPLKHVDKLFDINFKKNWNRKFQEFSTKNRIYCPARRCGEWIRPENMHRENGKKYGKCGRCKTKVCCTCNGKWHGSKDCPKDEETNRLLETAKQAGWQRCYNCRTMVELKEGCNHMTCHCTAEFCMICGLKWKSCNCPWFNYEAVEEDRLNHMQVPQAIGIQAEDLPRRLRRPRPNTYVEEITERQRQERRDEELARRLERDDDYQAGIGYIQGVGNGTGHFMNQDYVRVAHNILTNDFDHATTAANYVMGVASARGPPAAGPRRMNDLFPAPASPPSPQPMFRRHSVSEQHRAAERLRTRNDHEAEATLHAPLRRSTQIPPPTRPGPSPRAKARGPRDSVLAGLGGRGNRVSAWRSHIEPGVTPEEGVISLVQHD